MLETHTLPIAAVTLHVAVITVDRGAGCTALHHLDGDSAFLLITIGIMVAVALKMFIPG